MTRRDLLSGAALVSVQAQAAKKPGEDEFFAGWLTTLMEGYLRNAHRTSSSMAVCDFAGGKKRPDGLARSGKSYCSVSRMLPALAACVMSGRDPDGKLYDAVLAVYRSAFDPQHEDYWEASPPAKPDLRQVEASLIAWVLWALRDRLLHDLKPVERTNLQNWLASCTVHPVRSNNFAWFTAVNQAVRLALSEGYPEFRGDEAIMLADLAAMDEMYVGDGWYSDGKGTRISDYYSFWVFTSHYLYWREITAGRYPEWERRFTPRVKQLLSQVPQLFASNGAHAMMGVSLVYRWAILTALVLGYKQGMWPHAPGLLRGIVRRNLQFFWNHGAFDPVNGKLRESMSATGTPEFAESYIDNGHPYWGMQAFAFLTIAPTDPFWTETESALPCEQGDYITAVPGPGFLISGSKKGGDARLHFAANGRFDPTHRDRYTKFSYSGRFLFCYTKQRNRVTWDSAVVFRDPANGEMAGRAGIHGGQLIGRGLETDWWAELAGVRIRVVSRVFPRGEKELRTHTVYCPDELLARRIELWEGSTALPLRAGEQIKTSSRSGRIVASASSGAVGVLSQKGYDSLTVESQFTSLFGRENIHIVAPGCAIVTVRAALLTPVTELRAEFLCLPARGGAEIQQQVL